MQLHQNKCRYTNKTSDRKHIADIDTLPADDADPQVADMLVQTVWASGEIQTITIVSDEQLHPIISVSHSATVLPQSSDTALDYVEILIEIILTYITVYEQCAVSQL